MNFLSFYNFDFMEDCSNMKRMLSFVLAVIIILTCCSCKKEKETADKGKNDKPTTSDVQSSKEEQSSDETVSTESSDKENTDDEFVSSNVNSTSSTVSEYEKKRTEYKKVLPSGNDSKYYNVYPLVNHPGVVDLDATYDIVIEDKDGAFPNDKDITLTVNNSKVKINGRKIIVPYSVRKGYEPVTVTVKNKTNKGLSGSYTFRFQQFTEQPTFLDEFEKDTGYWTRTIAGNQSNEGDRFDEYPMGEIKDGLLIMTCDEESGEGRSTKGLFEQAYGCFSASIAMPKRGYVNVAFWMCTYGVYLKNPFSAYQTQGEIDIVECIPTAGIWASTLHYYGWEETHREDSSRFKTADYNSTEFNLYSTVWTPTGIYWYLNDQLVKAHEGEGVGPGSDEMFIILGVAKLMKNNIWGVGSFDPADVPIVSKWDFVKVHGLSGF